MDKQAQLVEKLAKADYEETQPFEWEFASDEVKASYREYVTRIVLPILKACGLVFKVEQKLPENPYSPAIHNGLTMGTARVLEYGFNRGLEDMINAGFTRIEEIKEG